MVSAGIIGSRCISSVPLRSSLKISIRMSSKSDSRVRPIAAIPVDFSDPSALSVFGPLD